MTDRAPGRERTVEASRRRFDRWAATYEEDRRSRRLQEVQRAALDALELGPDDRLLDAGCGTGAAARMAAPVVRRVAGTDLSPKMIERAQQLAAGLANVEFRVAEGGTLPYEDGAFTAVLCTSSLHHHPDPAASVREMARVLAPGGRIVLGDPSADHAVVRIADRFLRKRDEGHVKLYRSAELAGFLFGAGFERVALRRIWRGGYALLRARKPT